MSTLKLFLWIGVAVLLHFVGAQLLPRQFPALVDVFLVVLVLHSLTGNSLTSLLVGLLVGLLQDALTPGLYGLYGFADTIVGYGTARLAQRLVIQRATGVFAVASFASLLQQGVVMSLSFLLLNDPAAPPPLWLGLRAAICGGLGMVIYAASERFASSYESRRRNRMSKLRLD